MRVVNAMVLFLVTGAAHADCLTPQEWLRDVRSRSVAADVNILEDVQGQAAIDVVARLNATPPVTHMVADEIVVIGARNLITGLRFSYVLVGYFNLGCMVAKHSGDAEGVERWLKGEGA